jgi:di/tricarboxylate transporter
MTIVTIIIIIIIYLFILKIKSSNNHHEHQQTNTATHQQTRDPSMLDRILSSCRILLVLRFLTLSNQVKQEMATTWRVRHAIVNFLFVAVVRMGYGMI